MLFYLAFFGSWSFYGCEIDAQNDFKVQFTDHDTMKISYRNMTTMSSIETGDAFIDSHLLGDGALAAGTRTVYVNFVDPPEFYLARFIFNAANTSIPTERDAFCVNWYDSTNGGNNSTSPGGGRPVISWVDQDRMRVDYVPAFTNSWTVDNLDNYDTYPASYDGWVKTQTCSANGSVWSFTNNEYIQFTKTLKPQTVQFRANNYQNESGYKLEVWQGNSLVYSDSQLNNGKPWYYVQITEEAQVTIRYTYTGTSTRYLYQFRFRTQNFATELAIADGGLIDPTTLALGNGEVSYEYETSGVDQYSGTWSWSGGGVTAQSHDAVEVVKNVEHFSGSQTVTYANSEPATSAAPPVVTYERISNNYVRFEWATPKQTSSTRLVGQNVNFALSPGIGTHAAIVGPVTVGENFALEFTYPDGTANFTRMEIATEELNGAVFSSESDNQDPPPAGFPNYVSTSGGTGGGGDSNPDSDSDGLDDSAESSLGTNPYIADTDGDGFSDGYEVSAGSNPLNSTSTPDNIGGGGDGGGAGGGDGPNDEEVDPGDGGGSGGGDSGGDSGGGSGGGDTGGGDTGGGSGGGDTGGGDTGGTDDPDKDTDGDGISDIDEDLIGTNKYRKDTDGGGRHDGQELEDGTRPQLGHAADDNIGDGGDPWDPFDGRDDDGDGIDNHFELTFIGSDPQNRDTDGGGKEDGDEYFGIPQSNARDPGDDNTDNQPGLAPEDFDEDADNDGLSRLKEHAFGSSDNNPDTDGGGDPDGFEYRARQLILDDSDDTGANANDDSDGDGLTNDYEWFTSGTDPHNWDTDGGGTGDWTEVQNGTDPLDPTDDVDQEDPPETFPPSEDELPDPTPPYVQDPDSWYDGTTVSEGDYPYVSSGVMGNDPLETREFTPPTLDFEIGFLDERPLSTSFEWEVPGHGVQTFDFKIPASTSDPDPYGLNAAIDSARQLGRSLFTAFVGIALVLSAYRSLSEL